MTGNLWEWCWDLLLVSAAKPTPTGVDAPPVGSERMRRGGGYYTSKNFCRVSDRYGDKPYIRDAGYGFRLAYTTVNP
jgi:formylglycine-generating enzyme required for sulfatase activity